MAMKNKERKWIQKEDKWEPTPSYAVKDKGENSENGYSRRKKWEHITLSEGKEPNKWNREKQKERKGQKYSGYYVYTLIFGYTVC